MSEYLSNRKRNLNIGISSYTENDLVLDVIGNANISGITSLASAGGITTTGGDLYIGGTIFLRDITLTPGNIETNYLNVSVASTLGIASATSLIVSGITTIGEVTIDPSGIITSTNPGITTVTYYGDGSKLFGVKAFSVINQELTTDTVYPTFANNTGVSSIGISSEQFVFIPSTGSVGIGTTLPQAKLDVVGDVNVSGLITATTFIGNLTGTATTATNLSDAANITTGTISSDRLTGTYDINVSYANTAGISTVAQGLTGTPDITVGILTATTVYSNLTGTATTATNLSDAANITTGTISGDRLSGSYDINVSYATNAGIATYADTAGIATYATNSGIATYADTAGISTVAQGLTGTPDITVGILTATTVYANLTGIASTATELETTRTFEITGDIVAAPQYFNGTQNVSLASSIQPDTVGLGTHTYGDYVKNITGTIGEIEVSVISGEGVSPQIGLPDNVTVGNNLTVTNDLQVSRNLNVTGNITIGGTSAFITVNDFRVKDADIITGFTTDSNGNEVSNDTTANHGGIAVASTEGNPLVSIYNPSVGEITPPTYKKIMWFKANSFVGLNTDAWLINYGVGIGSTQVPNGVRLAVGGVQVTDYDILAVRDINASGIITATTFVGNLTGTATTATNLSDAANITTGTISSDRLTGTYDINVSYAINAGIATYATSSGIATYATNAGIATYATSSGIATYATNAGIATYATSSGIATYATSSGIATYATSSGIATYATSSGIATYATSSGIATYATTSGVSTSVIGGIGSLTQLQVTGISTFANGPVFIGAATSTGTASQRLQVTGGAYVSGSIGIGTTNPIQPFQVGAAGTNAVVIDSIGEVGIGTTNPTSKLHVVGNVLVSGIVTASTFVGNLTGTATDVISGVASVSSLQVTGISTLGITSTTNLTAQNLNVSGISTTATLNVGVGGTIITTTGIGNIGIGTTNPTAKLDINAGTATTVTNSSALNITQTWNNSASTFTGIKYNVTNTASASGSLLLDLQLGGSSVFNVSSTGNRLLDVKSGTFYVSSLGTLNSSSTAYVGGVTGYVSMGPTAAYQVGGVNCGYSVFALSSGGTAKFAMDSNSVYLCSGNALSFSSTIYTSGIDLTLNRDAANTFGQRNTTNAQTYRIYNTYTDASNYERAKLEWSGNVFRVGTERLGTGSTANTRLDLQTDGTTRVAISTTGLVGIGTTIPASTLHVLGNVLVAAGSSTDQYITLKPYELSNGTLSWEGSAGQLFSITNSLSTGSIFSVNDISGIPSIDVDAGGAVTLGVYGGNIGIGTTNPTSKLHVLGNALITGITTLGVTTATNLTSQNLNVSGVSTFTDIRIASSSEKTTLVSGNTVSLVYNTGGGNVAICTNPTGPITLNVTGIPTDSTFDNRMITFSVVAIQTSIGYACTAITLNGVSRTIRYPGAVVSTASTSSYDIFNLTGINTVGSASTTANYQVLGIVNGNFK